MDLSRRRGNARNGVVAGSVWESRMKVDEVKGGIKVFNGEENPEERSEKSTSTSESGAQEVRKFRGKQSLVGLSGKRKTCKSESFDGPIQIARPRSELSKNLDEQYKELSVSADGIKKSPVQTKKTRSQLVGKALCVSVDGIDKKSVQGIKARSLSLKGSSGSIDGSGRNSIQLKKAKSETNKVLDEEIERNAVLRKVKSDSIKAMDECVDGNDKNLSQSMEEKSESIKNAEEKIERNSMELREENSGSEGDVERIERKSVEIEKSEPNDSIKELDGCAEKVMTSSFGHVGQVKSPPLMEEADDDDVDWDDGEEELEEEIDEEIEAEKKSLDVKEVSTPEQKPKKIIIEEKQVQQRNEKPVPTSPIVKKLPSTVELNRSHEKPIPISSIAKKQSPAIVNFIRIHPTPTKATPTPVSDDFQRVPRTHNKLQSFVDLVMWRDVSKSAFVFGIGTFIIISSSYAKDLNVSLISVVSYLGLVYLAIIFLFRSIICRGVIGMDDTSQDYVVGEEDAVWVLKFVLPYLNEFLIKLRALFSGDPATTMKLAVLLFVLARCAGSITIWKMAKLGFFGVFTVPKVCSSYSSQLTAYGTFWIRRFRDAWESCSHKKAVGFVIFTLVWNLSSVVARIWAVFMLFVAFRYYQQSLMKEEWVVEEEERGGGEDSRQIGGQKQGRRRPTLLLDIKKQKRRS